MIRLTRFTARWLGFTALVATFTLGSAPARAYCPSFELGWLNHASIDCYLDYMSIDPYGTYTVTIPGNVFLEDESYCINFVCAPGYSNSDFSAMLYCDSMGSWVCSGNCGCTELPCSGTPVAPTGYVYGTCSGSADRQSTSLHSSHGKLSRMPAFS